jgi:hypothetical protein
MLPFDHAQDKLSSANVPLFEAFPEPVEGFQVFKLIYKHTPPVFCCFVFKKDVNHELPTRIQRIER